MKTKRMSSGKYSVVLGTETFFLEKLADDKYWTLYNILGTEINRAETKSGLLVIMQSWNPARVTEEATKKYCDYA